MKIKIHSILIFVIFFSHCDTKKEYLDDVTLNFACYSLAVCNHSQPSRIGMIGDSWTDLLVGYPLVETLRIQLEKNHGYQITGATLGGQTLSSALKEGLQYQVIDQSGAGVHVILLSLGGNDLQANLREYYTNLDSARASRFNSIKTNLKNLIQTGNAYKISKYGGSPVKWIIHGYDYTNPNMTPVIPDADEGCISKFTSAGFNVSSVIDFSYTQLDAYNEFLRGILAEEPSLYFVDLRGTLGGPSISRADLMFDCIHPNNLGFQLLGNRLSTLISPITGLKP
jgi:lysophospholipase L1-like esterase